MGLFPVGLVFHPRPVILIIHKCHEQFCHLIKMPGTEAGLVGTARYLQPTGQRGLPGMNQIRILPIGLILSFGTKKPDAMAGLEADYLFCLLLHECLGRQLVQTEYWSVSRMDIVLWFSVLLQTSTPICYSCSITQKNTRHVGRAVCWRPMICRGDG